MPRDPHLEDLLIAQDIVLVREEDYFLSLRSLAKASGLSVKKLRSFLMDPAAPLPHFRPGAKVLVRWSEFVRYMERYRAHPAVDIDQAVEEIMADLQAATPHGGRKATTKRQPHRRRGGNHHR